MLKKKFVYCFAHGYLVYIVQSIVFLSIFLWLAIKKTFSTFPANKNRKNLINKNHIKIPTIKLIKIIIHHLLKAYMFSTCFVEHD